MDFFLPSLFQGGLFLCWFILLLVWSFFKVCGVWGGEDLAQGVMMLFLVEDVDVKLLSSKVALRLQMNNSSAVNRDRSCLVKPLQTVYGLI